MRLPRADIHPHDIVFDPRLTLGASCRGVCLHGIFQPSLDIYNWDRGQVIIGTVAGQVVIGAAARSLDRSLDRFLYRSLDRSLDRL